MDQYTILSAAEACNSTFRALLDSKPIHQASRADLAEIVEEERAKFRIWATHIGTFAEHHASLDYRLRESETVRQLVITQLRLLHGGLSRILTDLHAESLNDKHEPKVLEDIRNTSSDTESQDIASDISPPSREDDISSVRGAIGRLYRLARAIRQPGVISQTSKATTFSPSTQFESEQEAFEDYALRIIQVRFGSATEALQKRLSKANEARRRLFLYRRHRQEILSGKRTASPERRPLPVSQAASFLTSRHQNTNAEGTFDESPSPVKNNIQIRDTQAFIEKATTFAESRFEPDASTKAVSSLDGTSIASFFEKSRLPLPPKGAHSGDYFECPYCCQLTPVKFLERKHWRQHLLQDLEPYVCLFEDCQQHDTRFYDRNQWILHLRSHAVRWCCRLPGHTHNQRQLTFMIEKEYTEHLKQHSKSGILSDAQIQILAEQCGILDPIPIKSCPLCHESLEVVSADIRNRHKHLNNSDLSGVSSISTMYKHIASHLVFIASYSLPWSDDVDENTASDISHLLFAEGSNDLLLRESTKSAGEEPRLVKDAQPLSFHDHDRFPEDYQKGEWDFVSNDSYEGQEKDDNLKAFKARAQIQTPKTEKSTMETKPQQAVHSSSVSTEHEHKAQLAGPGESLEDIDYYSLLLSKESSTSRAILGLGGRDRSRSRGREMSISIPDSSPQPVPQSPVRSRSVSPIEPSSITPDLTSAYDIIRPVPITHMVSKEAEGSSNVASWICDVCMNTISCEERRIHCTICDDYDLCIRCYQLDRISKLHTSRHRVVKVRRAVVCYASDFRHPSEEVNPYIHAETGLLNWTIDEKETRWNQLREFNSHDRYLITNVSPGNYTTHFHVAMKTSEKLTTDLRSQLPGQFLGELRIVIGLPKDKSRFLHDVLPETENLKDALFERYDEKKLLMKPVISSTARVDFPETTILQVNQAGGYMGVLLQWSSMNSFKVGDDAIVQVSIPQLQQVCIFHSSC